MNIQQHPSGLITVGKPPDPPKPPEIHTFNVTLAWRDVCNAIKTLGKKGARLISVVRIPHPNEIEYFIPSKEYQITYAHTEQLEFAEYT